MRASEAVSRRVNWSRVILEVFPRGIREIGVAMYAKQPLVDIVFESEDAMTRFDRETRELPMESETAELHTLLACARFEKSVYRPPTPTAG